MVNDARLRLILLPFGVLGTRDGRWCRAAVAQPRWGGGDGRLEGRLLLIVLRIVPVLTLTGSEDVVEGTANDVHKGSDEEHDLPLTHHGLKMEINCYSICFPTQMDFRTHLAGIRNEVTCSNGR